MMKKDNYMGEIDKQSATRNLKVIGLSVLVLEDLPPPL